MFEDPLIRWVQELLSKKWKRGIVLIMDRYTLTRSGIVYQKLNNEFCKLMKDKYKYVNREEDMGLDGLRHAKTSYRPCNMVEKYIAMMTDDKEAILRYSNVDPLAESEQMDNTVNM